MVPADFLGPLVASLAWDSDTTNDDAQLKAMFVSVALLLAMAIWWFLYRQYWRPVREARWVAPSAR